MKIKSSHLGLILILIMLVSSLATQRFYYPSARIALPEKSIIDYQLTPEQEIYLIQKGYTVILFKYSLTCDNCLDVKTSLEQFTTSDNRHQIILEEIESPVDVSNITISSMKGEENLINATIENVTDTLCEILIYPPVECALREV